MKEYDYLVCGQGLAGTLLAWRLMKAGCTVLVIDKGAVNTSSRVAAGMFTPVSGKRMVKAWLFDELYPELLATYTELEQELGIRMIRHRNALMSFSSVKEQNDFYSAATDKLYPFVHEAVSVNPGLQAPFGAAEVTHSGWVNTILLLDSFRQHLADKGSYLQAELSYAQLEKDNGRWIYDRHSRFKGIVFCQGHENRSNPFFASIPVLENKGDVFMIETELLDGEKIYKRGAYAVELEKGLFKAGSTYKWEISDPAPGPEGFAELKARTDALFNGEYRIVKHLAGIRPTTSDRRPVLGRHPEHDNLYMFNGLGTKGVLLAPYFSRMMCRFMLANEPLMPAVNSQRFRK